MSLQTIISISALSISILNIPFSYWIAVRQVKYELEASNKMKQKGSAERVISYLDEFVALLVGAAERISGLKRHEFTAHLAELNNKMNEIDKFVRKTGIFERLASSIDNLMENGYCASVSQNEKNDINTLRTIRAQICLGSSSDNLITATIYTIIEKSNITENLKKYIKQAD